MRGARLFFAWVLLGKIPKDMTISVLAISASGLIVKAVNLLLAAHKRGILSN